jgi:hypothetical protein
VTRLASRLGLPIIHPRCPNAEKNRRLLMKDILRQVSHVDKHAASNVYGAAWRINQEYLPGSITAEAEELTDQDMQ